MKPPMPYSGGKQTIAEQIVALFPAHQHYVEPFGGALSVLLAKAPAPIETVNDINGDLMNFWKQLRERPAELERACALTPHARAEFLGARDLDGAPDDLERARRVWVQITQSRGARLGVKTGWRFVHGGNRMSLARYLDGYLSRIAPAADRLRKVSLECRDALDVIAAFDRPDALFYVDPPYLGSTRNREQYAHELMSAEEHESLLEVLAKAEGRVVLSGYDSDLYTDLLTGWESHRFVAPTMTGAKRTEVVWTNFAQPHVLFGAASA